MDTLRYYIVPATTLAGVLGFLAGGPWVWAGAATFPVLMVLDLMLPPDHAPRRVRWPLLADLALFLQLPMLLLLYAAFARAVVTGSNPLWGVEGAGWQLAGSIASIAWLSAVPTLPVSHELWHRRHWLPRFIAKFLDTFYGDPTRATSHIITHHIHLDTPADSDTPHRGQNVYAFVWQAGTAAYRDAFQAQREMLEKRGLPVWHWRNGTYFAILLLLAIPVTMGVVAGPMATLVALASMTIARFLVEIFNYTQHYGLIRIEGAPVELRHAWNHLGMIVRPLGMEITNHINHHLDSYTPFYRLQPEKDAPQMPSIFVCFLFSLLPPLWNRFIARPRLDDWDRRFASPAELELAVEANSRAGWTTTPPVLQRLARS